MKNLHQEKRGKRYEDSARREIEVMGVGGIKGGYLKRTVHLLKKRCYHGTNSSTFSLRYMKKIMFSLTISLQNAPLTLPAIQRLCLLSIY